MESLGATDERARRNGALRIVIADDEDLPRRKLRRVLEQMGEQVVAECADGEEAAETIRRLRPDAAFVDIHMPLCDGLELARRVADTRVKIVFVTAHDRHALTAFEIGANDYVLKPIARPRLEASVARLREQLATGAHPAQPSAADDARASGRLLLRLDDRQIALFARDIRYVTAEGNYVRYAVGERSYLCRGTMAAIEELLSGKMFCRISRSTLVNVRWIREIEQFSAHGDCVVVLNGDTTLTVSRSYRRDLEQFFVRLA